MYLCIYVSIYLSIYRSIVVVVVVVVVVAVVVEVRVVKLVKLLKLVKLVKLISVYFFDISTSKKAQNPQFFTLLTSKCASRHNGVHFFDTFSTSEPPKVVRDRQFLTLSTWKCASRHNGVHFFNISTSKSGPELRCFVHLTWKCASRHNGVHFFDITTSKSGPELVCFVHFDLEMCFAPQRRALFWHLYFQKCSDHGVFCTFWLGNLLRATTACNFSSLVWPAGSAPAALASLLFDPPEPQIIGKTQCSRLSYLFAHLHLLSSDSFSSYLLSSNLPLLRASALLCFSSLHIVGSLTSKLPSIIPFITSYN